MTTDILSARVVDAYHVLPETGGALWRAEIDITAALFDRLPIRPEWTADDPYQSAAELGAAWRRGEFRVFTGFSDHPVFTETENHVGRAVHDWWGHGAGTGRIRAGFGLAGEIRAWWNQCQQYPRYLWPVLAGEIVGQVAVEQATGSFPAQRAIALPDEWVDSLIRIATA